MEWDDYDFSEDESDDVALAFGLGENEVKDENTRLRIRPDSSGHRATRTRRVEQPLRHGSELR